MRHVFMMTQLLVIGIEHHDYFSKFSKICSL